MDKSPEAFRTISEVAEDMELPQHVLRFWETRFPQIKPLKRGGGRRYYRPADVGLLRAIKELLYGEGYTIRGVQKLLREQGASGLVRSAARGAGEGAAEA
ncbi:MAG: MerR family transcriptional regulator, partial [Roseiarcus sp.]